MAYQTGTAATATSLIGIIETFCTSNGWTLTSGVLGKSSSYVKLTSINTEQNIKIEGSRTVGFTTGNAPNYAQTYVDTANWPVTYHLFAHASPDTVMCLLVFANGVDVEWLAFGAANKIHASAYVGGEWFAASGRPQAIGRPGFYVTNLGDFNGDHSGITPNLNGAGPGALFCGGVTGNSGIASPYTGNSYFYGEIDSKTWLDSGGIAGTTEAINRAWFANKASGASLTDNITQTPTGALWYRALSEWNQQTVLLPYSLYHNAKTGFLMYLGEIGHIRACNIKNYAMAEIKTLGSDDWMLFPWVRKDATVWTANRNGSNRALNGGIATSGTLGFAIKYDGP